MNRFTRRLITRALLVGALVLAAAAPFSPTIGHAQDDDPAQAAAVVCPSEAPAETDEASAVDPNCVTPPAEPAAEEPAAEEPATAEPVHDHDDGMRGSVEIAE